MRISAKADYALRALMEISRHDGDRSVTANEVADAQSIPRGFLLAILSDLRRAELVGSQRGKAGGWLLARPPSLVTVADVIRAVDGPLASVHGKRPEAVVLSDASGAALQRMWIAVRHSLREVLESVTLADLVRGELPPEVDKHAQDEDAWRAH